MSIRITTREASPEGTSEVVWVLDCEGRITLGEGSSTYRDTVRELHSQGKCRLLLNLAGVSYIDNSGIGELVSSFTSTARQGGSLKLLNLPKRVKELLQITKLYAVFQVYDDEAEAVRSFLL